MKYRFQHRDQVYEVEIERRGGKIEAAVNGQVVPFEPLDAQPGQISLRVGGRSLTAYYAESGATRWVSLDGCTYKLEPPKPRRSRQAGEVGGGEDVRAPMPAQVRAVQVTEGELVQKGQVLLLLEAMKMEIRVKSPVDGRVTRLPVKAGQAVEKEQLLAELVMDAQDSTN